MSKAEASTSLVISKLEGGIVEANFEALEARILQLVEDYKGMEVTAAYVPQAKRDRAYLNSLKKSLDAERLRVKREYMLPLEQFEARVKSLSVPIEEASAHIDRQVKEYETRAKEQKRQDIEEYWQSFAGILADAVSFDLIFDPRWLNVSVNIGTVYEEIEAITSRIAVEEQTLDELALPHADDARATYFATLDFAAAVARSKEIEEREAKARQFAADKAEIMAAREPASEPVADVKVINVTPDVAEVSEWEISVHATRDQVSAVVGYMRSMGLTGMARKSAAGF